MAAAATTRGGIGARLGRSSQAILLTREGVFAIPTLSAPAEVRLIGSLADYAHAMLARPQTAGGRLGGVFGEARRYAQQLNSMRFCLNELLPLLRASGGGSGHGAQHAAPLSPATFRKLARRGKELLRHLDRPPPRLESNEELAVLLGAPCAIVGGEVIPLSPAVSAPPGSSLITINSERYLPHIEGTRLLDDLVGQLRQEQKRRAQQRLQDHPELNRMATEFLTELKTLLDRCGPLDCGQYQLFHRDSEHQLQHCRGHWILVRGPVERRLEKGNVYVGLPLMGRTRRDWIAAPPRTSVAADGFWGPRGGPLRGGICMGYSQQYSGLSSKQFSDAEAVVEWLDAGVILVTGRSDFHRMLRAGEETDLPGDRIAMMERLFRSS